MPLPGVPYLKNPGRFINFDLLRLISSEKCGQSVVPIRPNHPFKSKPYLMLIAASTTILLYLI